MIIGYTVTADAAITPDRVGTIRYIQPYVDGDVLKVMTLPRRRTSIVTAEVADGTVNEVTVKGKGKRIINLEFSYIDDARFDIWDEFHKSTEFRGNFTIDCTAGLVRHHSELYDCQRVSDSAPDHYNHCNGLVYNFTVEVFN